MNEQTGPALPSGGGVTQQVSVEVTVLHAEGCHLCDDALAALSDFSGEFPLVVRVVEMDSVEGRELLRLHRPPMPPLVLVDGRVFGWGRLSRRKFRKLLEARGSGCPRKDRA